MLLMVPDGIFLCHYECADDIDERTRRKLLKEQVIALIKPLIQLRDMRPLSRELRDVMVAVGGTTLPAHSSESEPTRIARCFY